MSWTSLAWQRLDARRRGGRLGPSLPFKACEYQVVPVKLVADAVFAHKVAEEVGRDCCCCLWGGEGTAVFAGRDEEGDA